VVGDADDAEETEAAEAAAAADATEAAAAAAVKLKDAKKVVAEAEAALEALKPATTTSQMSPAVKRRLNEAAPNSNQRSGGGGKN
jgi:hypothetical protein